MVEICEPVMAIAVAIPVLGAQMPRSVAPLGSVVGSAASAHETSVWLLLHSGGTFTLSVRSVPSSRAQP